MVLLSHQPRPFTLHLLSAKHWARCYTNSISNLFLCAAWYCYAQMRNRGIENFSILPNIISMGWAGTGNCSWWSRPVWFPLGNSSVSLIIPTLWGLNLATWRPPTRSFRLSHYQQLLGLTSFQPALGTLVMMVGPQAAFRYRILELKVIHDGSAQGDPNLSEKWSTEKAVSLV